VTVPTSADEHCFREERAQVRGSTSATSIATSPSASGRSVSPIRSVRPSALVEDLNGARVVPTMIAVPESCAALCTKLAELAQHIDDELAQTGNGAAIATLPGATHLVSSTDPSTAARN
jgi:hypothetical protein